MAKAVKKKELTIRIETPEHVEIQFELAGIGTRFIAFVVDRLIQVGLVVTLIAIVLLILYAISRVQPSLNLAEAFGGLTSQWVIGAAVLVYGVVIIGYFIIFEYFWSGLTPGKRYQEIRVIRRDGRPIALFNALVRNILRSVDILFEVYPIGLAVMFIDSRNRRLGDLAAGTLVIVDRHVSRPADRRPVRAIVRPDLQAVVALMTPEDYYIVSSFLSRRNGLDSEHRRRLAEEIYARLFRETGTTLTRVSNVEALLQASAELYRKRSRVL